MWKRPLPGQNKSRSKQKPRRTKRSGGPRRKLARTCAAAGLALSMSSGLACGKEATGALDAAVANDAAVDSAIYPIMPPPDAGPSDAGPSDAGPNDAGASDAAAMDAGVDSGIIPILPPPADAGVDSGIMPILPPSPDTDS